MFVFTKWRTVSVFLPTANIWATLEKKSNTNLYTTKKQIITCNLFIKRKKLLWTYSGQIIVTCSLLALNGYNTHVYMSKSIQYTCSHAYTIYKNWDQSMYFWRTFILSIKKCWGFQWLAFHVAVSLTGTGLTLIKTSQHMMGDESSTHCIKCYSQIYISNIVTYSNGRTLL